MRLSLLALLSSVAAVELVFVINGVLDPLESGLLFLITGLGMAGLWLRPQARTVSVLALLLASLSVLLSSLTADELREFGGLAGPALALGWNGLLLLFPFALVHFSLTFPVGAEWLERKPHRALVLYAPWLLLVVLYYREDWGGPIDQLAVLLLPLGIFSALGVFFRQYFFALTPAERNRLRLILIGFLAGAVPHTVAIVGELGWVQTLTFFLVPLFPMALAAAVLKENFSEVSPAFHRSLIVFLSGAGTLTGLCFFFLMARLLGGSSLLQAGAVLLSGALLYPLWKGARAYIGRHFRRWNEPAPAGDSSSDFQLIHPNPYIVGNPVRSPEMFFGRLEDFHFVRVKLQSQRHGCALLLHGERRAGKTSLLYQILNGRLGGEFVPVFVDLQGVVVGTEPDFLQWLADRLRDSLPLSSEEGAASHVISDYQGLARLVDFCCAALAGKRLLLLLDEFELIEDRVRLGKLSPEIFGFLGSLLERQPRLNIILAGSRPPEEMTAWAGLVGRSFQRRITFLAWADAERLIRTPLAGRVRFGGGIVEGILRLTHGHPFYVQFLCQSLVETLNERRSNLAGRRVMEETVQRFLENPPPQLLYHWGSLSFEEKLTSASLAGLLTSPAAYGDSRRVEEVISSLPADRGAKIESAQVRIELERLRSKLVLDRDQTRYRFTMDLMRLWLRREHSVWSVLMDREGPTPRLGSQPPDLGPKLHRGS